MSARRHRRMIAALAAVVLAGGCSQPATSDYVSKVTMTTSAGAVATTQKATPLQPDLTGTGPGTLVSATELSDIDGRIVETGARVLRVEYRSTSGSTGKPSVVGGAVFVPGGNPPAGGWPVIAFGHSISGARLGCGPSLHGDLLGNATAVAALLSSGYLVTMTDYEGLGSAGLFSLFDSKTLGANMIDAVRAAHKVTPDASPDWAAYGTSLGGQAAWAANEMAATYGPEYPIKGSVALVPTVNVSGLVGAAVDGSMTSMQQFQYTLEVLALKATSQKTLRVEQYLSGETVKNLQVLTACTGAEADRAAELIKTLPRSDVKPITKAAADRLVGYLNSLALPKNKLTAPMLVIYSTADDLMRQQWIEDAMKASCGMGSQIETVLRVGQGTADLDGSPTLPWIKNAFDGATLTDNIC